MIIKCTIYIYETKDKYKKRVSEIVCIHMESIYLGS